jgi:hypothetical protein
MRTAEEAFRPLRLTGGGQLSACLKVLGVEQPAFLGV